MTILFLLQDSNQVSVGKHSLQNRSNLHPADRELWRVSPHQRWCVSVGTTSQHTLTADLAVPPADFLICFGRRGSLFSGFRSDSKASHISLRFQCLSESLTFYTHCLDLAFVPGISKPGTKSAQLLLEATTAFLSRDFCIPASLTTE